MPAVTSYAPRGQTTRGPSRHRPQRVPVFRNDNWPPRPPAQPLPAPTFLGSPDSDTLRALPTPSFVTPPENPPKPAAPSKTVIAASAVPLADWFADVVWALYLGPVQSVATSGNSGLAGADKAPPALAAFVHAVLSQTLASPQCAALGLYYLVRLPVRLGSTAVSAVPLWNVGLDAEGHTAYTSVQDRKHAARAGFVAELYGPGGEDVPYRLAALALMLGNKWLDDHTFTNKTWHGVTHLSLPRITALEQRALECFNYSLGVPNDDWRAWLGVLKEGAQGALASSPSPIPMSTLAIQAMDRLEKELEVLVGGVGAGVVDVMSIHTGKGVIGDRRASVSATAPVISTNVPVVPAPASATEMELDELEMEQVEIDIDLDDGGPVPEELRRPVKVRLGAGGEVKEEDVWAKGKDAWEKEGGKGVWKGEDVWKNHKQANWGKTEGSWGKPKNATWKHKGDTWHFMEEDQDEWERAIRAAGVMDDHHDHHDHWPNPVGNELRHRNVNALPRVQMYGHGGYAYPDYPYYPDYPVAYKGYDAIGKGTYEYPTQGVYYAPAYEAVPRDYDPGCVYEGGYHYGRPRQVPVPTWSQKSGGCVLG
ncbi:cyclin protein [Rhizoctonia solani AG-3 Rhs1AP]|uniref:Cyclin protein n=1 Tax=Rhizoctonia solani AG-3 Rhs1AP TaxID=1086054 RepID=X8JGX6_9AGAM|nr:cyclin protein [Rhizoctonia solani AG-3 Rhs1AP]